MLRIGCVKYLNARSLIHGWSGAVDFDHPAALCRKLERGKLDVALVSSLEYLRRPIYRIVDGASISAHGAVYSVIVAHNEDFSCAEEIEIDPASETSVALLQCLLSQRGLHPRLVRNTGQRPVFRALAEHGELLFSRCRVTPSKTFCARGKVTAPDKLIRLSDAAEAFGWKKVSIKSCAIGLRS